ncbi:MAG: M20/M25/M40 family metallo-hydrolase, partial [Bacillota bacterium]
GVDYMQEKIKELFYNLVKIQSDTHSILERDVEKFIKEYLNEFDYFKKNSEYFGKFELNDSLKRSIIWGLVKKGTSKKTVILLHHHDVVDSCDYGAQKDLAYRPKELRKSLSKLNWNEEVRKDIEDENWIFGRGTADMKAGGAIQIELLREFSKKDFDGNILLLSVPDEETFSEGMRKGIELLTDLRKKHKLKYSLLIDSEPHKRKKENEGVIFDGSVGKIMPTIYVKGFKSHIGEIFSGLNPLLILSKIMQKTETSMLFSDKSGNESSPPPSWSYLKDFKKNYDASIPEAAGGYFSVLTMSQTPKDVLSNLKKLSKEAFEESILQIKKNYKIYSNSDDINWKVDVCFFSELYERAFEYSGKEYIKEYKSTLKEIRKKLSSNKITLPESNFLLIEKTLDFIDSNQPIVVIGISPPFYPHVSMDNIESEISIGEILKTINKSAKKFDESYKLKKYFAGISDMSYTSLNKIEEIKPYIEKNMPLWGEIYEIEFDKLKTLNIPSINLGPWGKDLHKKTERVFKKDVFENTPVLIKEVIEKVLMSK